MTIVDLTEFDGGHAVAQRIILRRRQRNNLLRLRHTIRERERDANHRNKAPCAGRLRTATERDMRSHNGLVGTFRLDLEAHHNAGNHRNNEHQHHGNDHMTLMINAPHQRQERFRREMNNALGLQNLRKISEMRNKQQRNQQQHSRSERPTNRSGTHRTENQRRNNRSDHTQRETKRTKEHIRSENRISRLHENRKSQNNIRQCTEGGGGDCKRANKIRNIKQRAMIMPIRSDATCEQRNNEHRDIENHTTPQRRVIDERTLIDHRGRTQRGEHNGTRESDNKARKTPVRAQRLVTPLTDREHHVQRHNQQSRCQRSLQHRDVLRQHLTPFVISPCQSLVNSAHKRNPLTKIPPKARYLPKAYPLKRKRAVAWMVVRP